VRSLDNFATGKLAALEATRLRRTLAETTRTDGLWVERNGRRLLSFSCNDYLNLTHHPAVKAAAIAAVETYGAGAGASRLVTGNHPLLTELEERLTSLRAQLHGLGATWRDQEHKKFVEDFEEHMKVIGRYVEVTNEHAPFLLRKADRIEEYLQQR